MTTPVSAVIFEDRSMTVHNHTVGLVMAELVRRLRRDGWDGPDATLDEWGYNHELRADVVAIRRRLEHLQ